MNQLRGPREVPVVRELLESKSDTPLLIKNMDVMLNMIQK